MAATRSRHVYLDVTDLSAPFIKRRFPTIYSTCLRYDIDMTEEWIPVSPSVHYMMGGVRTETSGATTLPGLFAAGEVACSGVHGANRLASNSLLEGLVFGTRAARAAIAYAACTTKRGHPCPTAEELTASPLGALDDADKMRSSLRRLMWGKVGLVRTGDSLASAVAQLCRWERAVNQPFRSRRDLEVKNMVQVARCIAEAAMWRTNSVGAHYRADFPQARRPERTQHSCVERTGESIGLGMPRRSLVVVE